MKTNEDKNRFLEALEKTPFIIHASKQVGIDKATIYRWMANDKGFKKKAEEALSIGRSSVGEIAESQIIKRINQGDFHASKFYLENNDPRYIKPRINVFLSRKNNEPGLTDEEKENIDKILSG